MANSYFKLEPAPFDDQIVPDKDDLQFSVDVASVAVGNGWPQVSRERPRYNGLILRFTNGITTVWCL